MNLTEKRFLLEALFEHVAESIIVTDGEGKIRLVNPATLRLFGYTAKEITGQVVEFLLPDRFVPKHFEYRSGYYKNPHAREMGAGSILFAKRKDGSEFPVEISLTPFKSGNQSFVIAFIVDVTKRKEAEKEILEQRMKLEVMTRELMASNERLEIRVLDRTKILREALTELEHSKTELAEALEKEKELNELKSRFLSMASHEFRTPLTTILSSIALIDDYKTTEQNDKRNRHVIRIKSAVNNLNDILSDFLSISKIEEGKVTANYSDFKLCELVRETVGELKGLLKKGQTINVICEDIHNIHSDTKLVRNIIINLVSNAIKFSFEDSQISVEISSEPNHAIIKVTDRGIGISEDDKKHLFERFFRGQNVTNIQGTGLGLNIVANYVNLLQGKIEAESKLDYGTSFKVSLPRQTGV